MDPRRDDSNSIEMVISSLIPTKNNITNMDILIPKHIAEIRLKLLDDKINKLIAEVDISKLKSLCGGSDPVKFLTNVQMKQPQLYELMSKVYSIILCKHSIMCRTNDLINYEELHY